MRLVSEVRERLRAVLSRAREEREMEAEMRFHLDMETERLAREEGLPHEEARRRAAVAFGGEERFKEEVRDARGVAWLEHLLQDVRYGLRSLRRAPVLTLVIVVTLALGIGATTTLFTIVNAVLLRPLPYPHADRIVSISEAQGGKDGQIVAVPDFAEWARSSRSFAALALYHGTPGVFGGPGDRALIGGESVSWQFFRVFGESPVLGRTFSREEDNPDGPDLVVLAHDLWESRFHGDPAVVGRTITLDDHPYTVLGVMPAGFHAPRAAEFWVHIDVDAAPSNNATYYAYVVGRLRNGVHVQAARAELAAMLTHARSVVPGAEVGPVEPVVMTLHERMFGSTKPALLLLLGAVAFLLLIACANVANLLLARASSREHELAVRVALGAPRWRLARQLLWESVVVSVLGGGMGLLIPVWSVAFFVRISPASVAHVAGIHVDGTVLVFTVAVSLLTGLVFGLIPALAATRPGALASLKEGGTHATATAPQHMFRRALVVGELATAMALLTGAGLLTRSFVRAMDVDVGFHPDHALQLTVRLTRTAYPTDTAALTFFEGFARRLRALPGVTAVGYTDALPTSGYLMTTRLPLPSTKVLSPPISVADVSPGFMAAFGSEVVAGRAIDARDRAGTQPVVVLSASAARALFPHGSAVGKQLTSPVFGKEPRTVVGVVKDIQERGPATPRLPQIYQALTQAPDVPYALAVRFRGSATPLVAASRKMGAGFDPMQAVLHVSTMNEELDQLVAPRRFDSVVIDVFTALALVLAAVGLYGVMAYQVAQRTRELGIRMALGADRARVLRYVFREGLALALLGTVLGVALSLALSGFLAALLFEVSQRDPTTFAVAPAVMLLVALLACYLPALRATKVDPIVLLHCE